MDAVNKHYDATFTEDIDGEAKVRMPKCLATILLGSTTDAEYHVCGIMLAFAKPLTALPAYSFTC